MLCAGTGPCSSLVRGTQPTTTTRLHLDPYRDFWVWVVCLMSPLPSYHGCSLWLLWLDTVSHLLYKILLLCFRMYNNRLNKPVTRVKSLITYTLLSVVKITHSTDVKHQHFLAGDWTVTVCVVVESKSKEWRSFFLFPPEDNKGTVTRSLRFALELDFGLATKNI